MFDIAFSEILVIMVVALLILGPERLPAVARTLGRWWGGLQRYVNRIKADVTTSMELEELRQMERRIKAEADALERTVQKASGDLNGGLQQLEKELERQQQETAVQPAVQSEPAKPVESPAQPR